MKYRYFFAYKLTTSTGAVLGGNAQLELDREIEDLDDIHDAQDRLVELSRHHDCKMTVIENYILMKVIA